MRTIIHWRKISTIYTQHIYIKHLRYNNNQIIITENFTIMAKKEKSAFMRWYESYRGQRAVGVVYNIGASIVIIGALFKILHWPLASQVLMVGMFTESFLFFIGVLEKPHPVYHWEDIFPQLLGQDCNPTIMEAHKDLPRPNFVGNIGGNGSVVETSAKEKGVSVPAVSEEARQRCCRRRRSYQAQLFSYSPHNSVERYFIPPSGRITTMLPFSPCDARFFAA